MTANASYYRAQASAMRDEAADTSLDNVRDRCLRAALVWDDMAHRAERHKASVAKADAAKALAALSGD